MPSRCWYRAGNSLARLVSLVFAIVADLLQESVKARTVVSP
jgi:hypothetical protein